jgi:hypothetical protein
MQNRFVKHVIREYDTWNAFISLLLFKLSITVLQLLTLGGQIKEIQAKPHPPPWLEWQITVKD